jgi:hypothetical protein
VLTGGAWPTNIAVSDGAGGALTAALSDGAAGNCQFSHVGGGSVSIASIIKVN